MQDSHCSISWPSQNVVLQSSNDKQMPTSTFWTGADVINLGDFQQKNATSLGSNVVIIFSQINCRICGFNRNFFLKMFSKIITLAPKDWTFESKEQIQGLKNLGLSRLQPICCCCYLALPRGFQQGCQICLVQHTKRVKNIPKIYQTDVPKYTKWRSNIPNSNEIYQHFPF
jgi:hypothetical protein